MKKIILIISLLLSQNTHSMDMMNQFNEVLQSPQIKQALTNVITVAVLALSAKLGLKEFQKGKLFPTQTPQEKSSEVVKQELENELKVHRKVLLHLLSLLSEENLQGLELLLSEEEQQIFVDMFV